MLSEALGISLLGSVLTLAGSILFAEFVGYLLHRLLHSDRFPSLSRAHLIHHFEMYGPTQPMRAENYKDATDGRASLGNIGMEWIAPIALVLALSWMTMSLLDVPRVYQAVALATMVAWPVFMFSYLHDRMHLQNFWMERTPILKIWFLRARRLHDIHHHSLDADGHMDRNFGIGFFLFDRLFRTIARRHCPLNLHGYRAAARRYHLHRQPEDELQNFPSGFRV